MYNAIFEISEKPFEDKFDLHYFSTEDVEDMPEGVIYLGQSMDRETDIKEFEKMITSFEGVLFDREEESFVTTDAFKKDYFRERFHQLQLTVSSLTPEMFYDDKGDLEMYRINKLIENKFDIRAYNFDRGHMSFDRFVREMEPGVRYYIGSVGEYKH